MQYKKVSKIEEALSVIGIGCWNFGGNWDSSNDDNSERIVLAGIEQGINFFDIAPVYGFYHSETVLGTILKKNNLRNRVIIASKCGLLWDENHNTRRNLTKESILCEIDQSLRRLQTDHVDIYQLHWPDHNTPIENTVEALQQIKNSGKIRYVGLSNFSQADVETFETMIEINSQQSLYNMLERNTDSYHGIPLEYKTEKEVFPHVRQHGQAFLPYSPLFQGLLSGRFKKKDNFSDADIRSENPKFKEPLFSMYYDTCIELCKFSEEIGKPLYEISLNWLRQKPEITSIIAGARSPKQLLDNLHCLTWDLTDDMLSKIDQIIAPLENK